MASTSEENVHVEEVVVVTTTPDISAQSPSEEDMKNMLETAELQQPEWETGNVSNLFRSSAYSYQNIWVIKNI